MNRATRRTRWPSAPDWTSIFGQGQRHASGLPAVDPDERAFSEEDLCVAGGLKRFLDAGLPPEGLLESARVFGQAGQRSAAAVRTLLGESLVRPGDTERDIAIRFADAARELHSDTVLTLAYLFRAHLLHQLRSDLVDQADLAVGRVSATHEVAVCFVDLVGFTRLGERAAPEDIGRLADRLGGLASEVAEDPVRLVKTIGDAAMFVSPKTRPPYSTRRMRWSTPSRPTRGCRRCAPASRWDLPCAASATGTELR